MGMFLVYILKSAVCLAVFYLFYRLLLSRETFHRFNRVALLSLLLLSCIIPFVEVTSHSASDVSLPFVALEEVLVQAYASSGADVTEVAQPSFTWQDGLFLIYILGIVFFLGRNVWSFVRLWRLVGSSNISKGEDGIFIITHKQNIAPFSWLRFIVISETDLAENGREILTHERAHIRACHSLDLMVADICILLQWFNPASWLLKSELQTIHEYEADESVIANGVDAKRYQMLLIKKAVGARLYSMANSFNHSSLKKRITMMLRKKSNPWARVKYLFVLPVAVIAVAAFAQPEVSNELKELSDRKDNELSEYGKEAEEKSGDLPVLPTDGTELFLMTEEMPEFPGGNDALQKFLSDNIQYPEVARQNGQEGRVILQLIVEKDGTITNARIERGISPELDAEALRILGIMPKWKPGRQRGHEVRVRMVLPIAFKL